MLVWLGAIFGALLQGVGATTRQLAAQLATRAVLVAAALVALGVAFAAAFLVIRGLATEAVGFVSSAVAGAGFAEDVVIWMRCLMPGSTMTAISLLVSAWIAANALRLGWDIIKLKAAGF